MKLKKKKRNVKTIAVLMYSLIVNLQIQERIAYHQERYRYRRSFNKRIIIISFLEYINMILTGPVLTTIFLFLTIGSLSEACELDQMRYGCRIYNAQCSCGYGCKAEYRYDSNEDCKLALRGRLNDTCYRSNPCLHGGSCSQISADPGFKCRCEGTGYFGTRCEKPCPAPNNLRYRGPFPYECVVI
ncbi:neurogenic locus notch homolog protein 3-like [Polistes fuscatus]|uniref:neurogenic locus notch homolog protein 3-like n=2 Tax=Polistes TaxID=7456 RepID=UPI001CA8C6D6|nr:neurogenic locus notch homolog protein 3-like [Polistes fuscatus]